jgi:hypothetical protein
MRIMKVKRAIIILLMIGVIAVISGCVRYPGEPEPEPGTDYQLKITVEVVGEINSYDGIYYIVLDTDEDSAYGPEDDLFFWDDDFYYIKLEDGFFYFARVEEGSPELQLTDSSDEGNSLQVIIALSDLGDPTSIDINVLTTDEVDNTYDSLSEYFTIDITYNPSVEEEDPPNDSEDGPDFDIRKVTAEITTLY